LPLRPRVDSSIPSSRATHITSDSLQCTFTNL
jgi:hypothetical protein